MDEQTITPSVTDSQVSAARRDNRNLWVLTAYGVSGLALFGVLLYFFSSYVTQ
jgi:hypothetical protein